MTFAGELLAGVSDAQVALVADDRVLTRRELADLVALRQSELALPDRRSVVTLTGPNSLEWVVTYLALLDAGHVPLLAASHVDRLAAAWSPAAVVSATATGIDIDRRWADPTNAPDLHPDLALLLSTSGSTGDPKLVRLSHRNLSSNARAIAEYLDLGPGDRGITALPLHYCYGLSVLHAHLVAGASVVLTDASVVDPCFRRALERYSVTNVAGVPHTFELLERVGVEQLRVPSLRLVTQAGGKLGGEAVDRWLDRTAAWGADFVVMYGQTEATARMAYLPPDLARRHPGAIGRAIPGGSLRLDPVEAGAEDVDGDVGELVYRGPNVMLGYARTPADLSLGRTVDELRTGDLARFHATDGVFEIIGRRSRFVKPFGLRIDLDDVERELGATLNVAMSNDGASEVEVAAEIAVGGDDHGIAIVAPGADAGAVRGAAARHTTLPPRCISVATDTPIPRTSSGKVDSAEIVRLARARSADAEPSRRDERRDERSVAAIFASVLGRDDIGADDTFVALGGDSLSYIECSIRLEAALGEVPNDWHLTPIGALTPGRRRRLARLDTTVLLRAVGICVVVSTHMRLWYFPGGAHLLLAVVGFNLSRFLIPIADTGQRLLAGLRTAGRAAVPTITWITIGAAVGATQGLGTLLLINNYVGPASHSGDHWHFWFIEVFVHLVLVTTVVVSIPAVRRADRRFPYLVPLACLGVFLLLRMDWAQMGDWYNVRYRTHGVAWFFALGWLVHRSTTSWTRLLTSALCLVTIDGFFRYAPREWFITGCLIVLIWHRELPIPRPAVRPIALVASASMWIYISHFTVWPLLVDWVGVRVAYVPTILVGVAIWAIGNRMHPAAVALVRRRRPRDVAHRPGIVSIA